jgi:hypothetical protein
MLIPVLYKNEKLGMVSPGRIDYLIARNEILALRRSSGWVFIGEDTIRMGGENGKYKGTEKRKAAENLRSIEDVLAEHEILYDICRNKK